MSTSLEKTDIGIVKSLDCLVAENNKEAASQAVVLSKFGGSFAAQVKAEEEKIEECNKAVEHPTHYQGTIEVIDFIESHDLNFNRGNIVKYSVRAGRKSKDTELEDLHKALFYLNREINRIK